MLESLTQLTFAHALCLAPGLPHPSREPATPMLLTQPASLTGPPCWEWAERALARKGVQ